MRTKRDYTQGRAIEFNTATRSGDILINQNKSVTYSWRKETPKQREEFLDWLIEWHKSTAL